MSHVQCPACGAEMSLDVCLSHEALRRATFDLLTMSLPLGALVMRYIALFKPAKNRLSPDRMAKLVQLLLPDMQRQRISHKGRDWHMPLTGWRAGLEAMLEKAAADKLSLPLDNHQYLYTVLAGMADKVEAVDEQAHEQQRRTQRTAPTSNGLVSVADAVVQPRGVPAYIREQAAAIKRGEPISRSEP